MPDASSVYRYFRLLSMLRRMHAPLTVITRLPSINCKMEAGSMPMRWPSMSEGRCVNQRGSRPNRYNGRQRIVTMDFIDLDRRFVRLRKDRPADLDLGHWGRLYGFDELDVAPGAFPRRHLGGTRHNNCPRAAFASYIRPASQPGGCSSKRPLQRGVKIRIRPRTALLLEASSPGSIKGVPEILE